MISFVKTFSIGSLLTAVFSSAVLASDLQEPQITALLDSPKPSEVVIERKPTVVSPKREVLPVTRIGVQSGQTLPLSVNDAIQRALENNNEIFISRTDVKIAETSVRSRQGIYDPVVSFSPNITHNQTTGNAGTNDLRVSSSFAQFIQPGGGSYTAFFNNNRTENAFAQAQASSGSVSSGGNRAIYTSSVGINYTQPLFRNFGIDSKRQAIKVAKKQLAQSDSAFRLQATATIASVQRAYWDLVFALRDQQNQVANLNLAKENLRQIEARIAAGAAAPLAKAEVETELANREGSLLSATQQVSIAENTLKQLIFGDPTSSDWNSTLVPTDKPTTVIDPADLDSAIKDAMDNRFELKRLKLATEINKIDLSYLKNQTKPQIDLTSSFSLDGLSQSGSNTATTTNLYTSVGDLRFFNSINQIRALGSINLPLLVNDTIVIPPSPSYLFGGFNRSWANMFRSDAPNYSIGVTISFPLRNRTAKANYEAAKLTTDRLAAETRSQEQQIIVEVRNAVQAVETARQRVLTARRARESAETQLDGERKLYDAGRSTAFILFQRENSLANARNAEIRSETDLNKAIAELQRVTATSFRQNNITLVSPVEIK